MSILRSLKVATPFTAVIVVVPERAGRVLDPCNAQGGRARYLWLERDSRRGICPMCLRHARCGVGAETHAPAYAARRGNRRRLLGALVLAELLLRVLDVAPTNGVATVTEREFGSVPGMLSPGQDFVDRRDRPLSHHVTTNALGYRGPEVALPKPAGEFRILLTGDSFAYCDFVDDDQTLPAQLERRLSGRCEQVRVVNASLRGYELAATYLADG